MRQTEICEITTNRCDTHVAQKANVEAILLPSTYLYSYFSSWYFSEYSIYAIFGYRGENMQIMEVRTSST